MGTVIKGTDLIEHNSRSITDLPHGGEICTVKAETKVKSETVLMYSVPTPSTKTEQ